MFNAPANLRYGNADTIGNSLDPMGDENGIMTRKEYEWFLEENYQPNGQLIEPLQRIPDGPGGTGGSYYWDSSSGRYPGGFIFFQGAVSWIRCYHNNNSCNGP